MKIQYWMATLVATVGTAAYAAEPYQVRVSLDENINELTMTIEDSEAVSGACDYHVRRFEYLASLNSVVVELGQDPCFTDRYGKRKAHFKWEIPHSVRNKGKICVVINQSKIGATFFERSGVSFRASEACVQ